MVDVVPFTIPNEQLKELAGKSAQDVLNALNLTTPPFDPFLIAERLGVNLKQDFTFEDLGKSGYIKESGKDIDVWINPTDLKVRQNFTLAHELGHLILHILTDQEDEFEDTPERIFNRSGEPCSFEYQANNFAGELLMPREHIYNSLENLFKENGNNPIPTEQAIQELSSTFNVSTAAMTVRLKVLKITS